MLATGRIDLIAQTSRYIYVIELKLRNNAARRLPSSRFKKTNIWNLSRLTSER